MDRIITARVRAQRWYVRFPRAVPMAIFLSVLTVAALGIFGIQRIDNDRTDAQVRAAAAGLGAALERRALAHVTYLRAGALLLSASGQTTPEAFQELAASVADDDENRGYAGISWAPRVALRDLPAFEAARRAEGLAGFTVYPRPATGRAFVVPVTYVSNMAAGSMAASNIDGPNPALGFDISSEPRRRAALERAAHDRRPTATGRVELQAPAHAGQSGFLIYMPVFARSPGHGRLPQAGALRGFIGTPFNAQAFLDAALATVPTQGLGVALYDGRIAPDRLLARVVGTPDPDLSYSRTLAIGGRVLVLVVAERSRSALSNLSLVTLLFALLVAALLMLLAHVVTRNAEEDLAALDWMQEQVSIRNTLTRELNHRVKNTLANVLSLIALTRRRATGLEDFAESLTGRVLALSATHDLLTGLSWQPAPLRAVVAAELAPYTEGRDHVIRVTGPEVALAPKDALSLGLAVHELATNAAKYGSLSVVSGEVAVSWEMMSPDLARIVWQEQDGPPVRSPRRRGFGTDLIEKIVAHELGHGVDLCFDPGGVRCTLIVPVREPVVFQMRGVT